MKIKVQDLTNEQLDYWVARAQGIEREPSIVRYDLRYSVGDWVVGKPEYNYHPTTNNTQAMALIEEFDVWFSSDGDIQYASCTPHINSAIQQGATKKEAACRAVIASKFGEEVEGEK